MNCCLLFVWQVNGGIQKELEKEVLQYNYHSSFFDIFVSQSASKFSEQPLELHSHAPFSSVKLLAVFRFTMLILAYAACKLRHWWVIAVSCCQPVAASFSLAHCCSSGFAAQRSFY